MFGWGIYRVAWKGRGSGQELCAELIAFFMLQYENFSTVLAFALEPGKIMENTDQNSAMGDFDPDRYLALKLLDCEPAVGIVSAEGLHD